MVNMRFEYLDEASMNGMEYILQQLYNLGKENVGLTINWYYTKENSLVKRVGMQYLNRSRIRFNLVAA